MDKYQWQKISDKLRDHREAGSSTFASMGAKLGLSVRVPMMNKKRAKKQATTFGTVETTLMDLVDLSSSERSPIVFDSWTVGYIINELLKLKEVKVKEGVCTCHERDSSYTCDVCRADGYYGHREEPVKTHDRCRDCSRWVKKGSLLCHECFGTSKSGLPGDSCFANSESGKCDYDRLTIEDPKNPGMALPVMRCLVCGKIKPHRIEGRGKGPKG